MLVVLPTITWQAVNPVEENGDGYPDVLPLDRAVRFDRPFAGSGRPPAFATGAALLQILRARRSALRRTTDLAARA